MKTHIKIFKPNTGNKILKISGFIGLGYIVSHLITFFITSFVNGFAWSFNALFLDLLGFFAGVVFTVVCFKGSKKDYTDFKKGFIAIFIWSFASIITRIFDILMLFGILKWDSIYTTPNGLILNSNIVSEILFGFTFNFLAFIGSILIFILKERKSGVREY